jgi:hypothetical protein
MSLLAGASIAIAVVPTVGHALPSYARQTGMACAQCHFQKYPALTAVGRAFKASGFTQMGPQTTIQGERLSVPSVLNASIFLKIRYQKTNGTDDDRERTTNDGELQFLMNSRCCSGGA